MKRYAKVLYVLVDDFIDLVDLRAVLNLGDRYHLKLTLFDVTSDVFADTSTLLSCILTGNLRDRRLDRRLEQLEALVSMTGKTSTELRARTAFGDRNWEIVREAAQGDYDLVIKHSEKKSTDRHLSKHCQCPIWLLTPEDYTESGELDVYNAPLIISTASKLEPVADAHPEIEKTPPRSLRPGPADRNSQTGSRQS